MTTLFIDAKQFAGVENSLCNSLDGYLKINPLGNEIILNGIKGEGRIFCTDCGLGISLITYDVFFHEDINIAINTLGLNPLYFVYAEQGSVNIRFRTSEKKEYLEDFQSMIISSSKKDSFEYQFKKREHYKLIIASVDREKYIKKADYFSHRVDVINLMFKNPDPLKTLTFTCGPDLSIADVSSRYCDALLKGRLSPIEIMGAVQLFIGHILGQFEREGQEPNLLANLTADDLAHVQELAKQIRNNPGAGYKIESMAAMTGLNPLKLQHAFKHLFNRTAADYIRNVRLEIAEHLLRKNDQNVSEVVMAVGLNSNSYFSKIFKEKYHCSPKAYQIRIQNVKRSKGALTIAG